MNLAFKSIRWRLQLWHGAILLLVLSAFGYTAFSLACENRLRGVDQELQQWSLGQIIRMPPSPQRFALRESLREAINLRDRPFFRDQPQFFRPNMLRRPMAPFRRPAFPPNLPFGNTNDASFYFAVWSTNNVITDHSGTLPHDLPIPPAVNVAGFSRRTRDEAREIVITTEPGFRATFGRAIPEEAADLERLAILLASAAICVLVLGLGGGWWLSARAIRPIKSIGVAAEKIASGNLAERIDIADTDTELGQLATVLNTTFDRLQTAFHQLQKSCERQAQFTADASHELRTPVSIIMAEAHSALARERTSTEYRESMQACQNAARRMHKLTESLSTLARFDSGEQPIKREQCELDRIAGDAADLLRPLAAEYGVRLNTSLNATQCLGDTVGLGQVVLNLVSNAIYYNKPEGEVRIAVFAENKAAVLRVQDTGIGMAEEDLPHIFERFYRADRARSRANGRIGLGLAITKTIVEAHAGEIHVVSELQKGSSFTVRFPEASGT